MATRLIVPLRASAAVQAKRAAEQAYAASGLAPSDVDVAEVHDCFSCAEVFALEAPARPLPFTLSAEFSFTHEMRRSAERALRSSSFHATLI